MSGVVIEVDGRRITAGRAGRARPRAAPGSGPPARGDRSQGSPTPSPRVPPGAPRADPARARHVLDLARPDVRRRRGSPRTRTTPSPAPSTREMVLAGVTGVGEFHYLHHAPGGSPTTTPTRWVRRCRGGRRGRDPDRPARHLLPRRRPRPRPLREVQLRFSDGTREAGPTGSRLLRDGETPDRRGGALGARPCRDQIGCGRVGRCPRTAAPLPPVRAGRGERGLPGRVRPHAHASCSPSTVPRPGAPPPSTRRTSPRGHRAARRPGTGVCMCPTTERDLADGIGPARALRDAGSPLSLG